MWGVYELAYSAEVHIAPVDEMKGPQRNTHDFNQMCRCCPDVRVGVRLDQNGPYFMITHEAFNDNSR